jgi:hypothetical protein
MGYGVNHQDVQEFLFAMTLNPTDMLLIQTAIDEYERKFPRRPAPSAKVALSWRLGKRAARRILAQADGSLYTSATEKKSRDVFAQQECNWFVWAWEQVWLYVQTWEFADDGLATGLTLWFKRALVVGFWGVAAVAVVSVFFLGALVGGFK